MKKYYKMILMMVLILIITTAINAQDCKLQANKIMIPPYPSGAVINKESGEVKIEVKIDSKGNVTDAVSLTTMNWLSLVSVEAAKRWKFPSLSPESLKECKNRKTNIYSDFVLLPENTIIDETFWSFVENPNRGVVKEIFTKIEMDKEDIDIE